jgi:hypothetical protein
MSLVVYLLDLTFLESLIALLAKLVEESPKH